MLFFTEITIALYVHDDFTRPYVGDFLVVILIYCFLMSFLNVSKFKIALVVLVFSFGIEFGQYFNLVNHLGLQDYKLAKVVLGNSFAFEDLCCYILGFLVIISIER